MGERRVDVLSPRWYVDLRSEPSSAPARWLDAARTHYPPAVPRRYGHSEPLRKGDSFAITAVDGMLFHSGSEPTYGGHLGGALRSRLWPFTSHSLDVDASEVDTPGLRALFTAFAAGGATLYASATVRRNLAWTGRTLYIDQPSDAEPYLAPLGQWLGLPPAPPTWAWFGARYARLVPLATGVLHTSLSSDEWVAPSVVARLGEVDPAKRGAQRMPRGVRTPWWRVVLQRPG